MNNDREKCYNVRDAWEARGCFHTNQKEFKKRKFLPPNFGISFFFISFRLIIDYRREKQKKNYQYRKGRKRFLIDYREEISRIFSDLKWRRRPSHTNEKQQKEMGIVSYPRIKLPVCHMARGNGHFSKLARVHSSHPEDPGVCQTCKDGAEGQGDKNLEWITNSLSYTRLTMIA